MVNVLIVDDRDIIKDSLKLIFLQTNDIRVIDTASDGQEALHLIEKNEYDVVLMDINMPIMNGIEATKRIVKLKPNLKILANSFYLNATYIKDMIKAGAYGFITKGEVSENYIEAIRIINNGAIYLSEEIDSKIYDKVLTYLEFPAKK